MTHMFRSGAPVVLGVMVFAIVWISVPGSSAGKSAMAIVGLIGTAMLSILRFAGPPRLVPARATMSSPLTSADGRDLDRFDFEHG